MCLCAYLLLGGLAGEALLKSRQSLRLGADGGGGGCVAGCCSRPTFLEAPADEIFGDLGLMLARQSVFTEAWQARYTLNSLR